MMVRLPRFATCLGDTPALDISLLFRLVRDDVLAATARHQEPYVHGSLPGEVLSFRP
jgi:hypothetical protein